MAELGEMAKRPFNEFSDKLYDPVPDSDGYSWDHMEHHIVETIEAYLEDAFEAGVKSAREGASK